MVQNGLQAKHTELCCHYVNCEIATTTDRRRSRSRSDLLHGIWCTSLTANSRHIAWRGNLTAHAVSPSPASIMHEYRSCPVLRLEGAPERAARGYRQVTHLIREPCLQPCGGLPQLKTGHLGEANQCFSHHCVILHLSPLCLCCVVSFLCVDGRALEEGGGWCFIPQL